MEGEMWRLEVEAAFLIASPVRKRRGGQWTLQIGSFSLLFGSGYKPREWWHHVQDTSSRLDLPSLNNSTPACSILRGLSSEWVWSDIMGIERKVALGGRLLIPRALSSSKGPSDIKPGRTTNRSRRGGLCSLLIWKLRVGTMEIHWWKCPQLACGTNVIYLGNSSVLRSRQKGGSSDSCAGSATREQPARS